MARAFSIKMFIPDGDPNGLRIISKSHWTGQGVVFNRSIFNEVKKRPEFTRPGVYVLVGENEKSTLPQVYIGEAECVIERLQQHYSKKEFWVWCIFFTSSVEGILNKAHVKYIESRLVDKALEVKLCSLNNDQTPRLPILSEAEIADAEAFLADMIDIYPLAGLNIFKKAPKPKRKNELFYINARGINGTGYESSEGFIVCQNTQAHKSTTNSVHKYIIDMRSDLIKQEVLIDNGNCYIFTQDYPFSSPSTAAGVVLGRNSNGRIEWKDKSGKTLKEFQSQ